MVRNWKRVLKPIGTMMSFIFNELTQTHPVSGYRTGVRVSTRAHPFWAYENRQKYYQAGAFEPLDKFFDEHPSLHNGHFTIVDKINANS